MGIIALPAYLSGTEGDGFLWVVRFEGKVLDIDEFMHQYECRLISITPHQRDKNVYIATFERQNESGSGVN